MLSPALKIFESIPFQKYEGSASYPQISSNESKMWIFGYVFDRKDIFGWLDIKWYRIQKSSSKIFMWINMRYMSIWVAKVGSIGINGIRFASSPVQHWNFQVSDSHRGRPLCQPGAETPPLGFDVKNPIGFRSNFPLKNWSIEIMIKMMKTYFGGSSHES